MITIVYDPTEPVHFHPLLHWFTFHHLKPELQAISQPFCELAYGVIQAMTRDNMDGTAGVRGNIREFEVTLRKLLEAKDAAVRGAMELQFCLEAEAGVPTARVALIAPHIHIPPVPEKLERSEPSAPCED